MIDFASNYTVDWQVNAVNPDTWDDAEPLEHVLSVTVDRDCTDAVPLYETASMTVYTDIGEEFEDGWYRVTALIRQDAQYERFPIATLLFQAESDEVDYGVVKVEAKGRSVLTPANELSMDVGNYVPKGANGAEWVVDRLSEQLISPVYLVGDGFTLDRYVIYDGGESVLSACWNVLDTGRWCLQIDGSGVVYVMARPDEPDFEMTVENLRYLSPGIRRSGTSRVGLPNRYLAEDFGKLEIAENDDPSSPISYTNVGRWIDTGIDSNPEYIDGESLWAYARRKLEEASTQIKTYDYTREYLPGVLPFSLIRGSAVEAGFVGDLRVTKQKLTLDKGISVSETANEEIKLWRA